MNKFLLTFNFLKHHPFASKHLIKALYKWISWQLKIRLGRGPFIVPFLHKTYLKVNAGDSGATGNIYAGLHEFEDMGFLLHFLNNKDIFYDIGANVGSFTILASGVKKAFSYSFEPIKKTFDKLSENITINNIKHLNKSFNCALSDKEDIILFTADFDTINHAVSIHESNINTVSIKTLALDEIKELPEPSLIKIDVEGYETLVLKGASHLLKSNNLKAIIIELNGSGERYGFDESKIHELLLLNDFHPYKYNPFNRELLKLSYFGSHNTIYIRDIDFVIDKLKKADSFNIWGTAI